MSEQSTETTTTDPLTRQIILSAVSAAGPVEQDLAEWTARVTSLAQEITTLVVSPSSPARRAVEAVTNADKKFMCIIQRVVREKSSTRAKITVKARPSKWHPDGIEEMRTDRTDDSPEALALARRLQGLIGRKVFVYIHQEETADGRKVRVVKAVEDLGEPTGNEFAERG